MGYGDVLRNALGALKLDKQAIQALAKDESALGWGFLTLALAGVASAIGTLNPLGIVMNPIGMIIGFCIGWIIIHLLALLFGGKASAGEFFRSLSNVTVLYWIAVIPILGPLLMPLAGLYLIVVEVVILKTVHQLSTLKAILVILIPIVLVAILAMFLAATLLATVMGTMGMAGMM